MRSAARGLASESLPLEDRAEAVKATRILTTGGVRECFPGRLAPSTAMYWAGRAMSATAIREASTR